MPDERHWYAIISTFCFLIIRPPPTNTLSLHDALPISFLHGSELAQRAVGAAVLQQHARFDSMDANRTEARELRSEEHTSELQSHSDLVCRVLLEKKKSVSLAERQRQ